MRAIIEITKPGDYARQALAVARAVDAGQDLPETDYHLGFENASQLFSSLTPARLALLEALKAKGPMTIYALAKDLQRNYSNVHTDVQQLLEQQLIERVEKNGKDLIHVPWDEVQIRLAMGNEAVA